MKLKVFISTPECDAIDQYRAECDVDTDPGEAIASVEVLYPDWTEILIERIPE